MYLFLFIYLTIKIHWNSRYNSWNETKPCGIVDTTECHIQNPGWEEWLYYSKKKQKHTLKYEVVVSAGENAKIIWVNGAFGGSVHDFKIATINLIPILDDSECLIGDKGYYGSSKIICPFKKPVNQLQKSFNTTHHKRRHSIERINKRLKHFNCLVYAWRHDIKLHEVVFNVICNITNITLLFEPLDQ